jgi:hypothetical protein
MRRVLEAESSLLSVVDIEKVWGLHVCSLSPCVAWYLLSGYRVSGSAMYSAYDVTSHKCDRERERERDYFV